MNGKFIRIGLCLGVVIALTACASTGPSTNELVAEGTTRNVPLLIYNTSWNGAPPLSVHMKKSLAVGLINTGHGTIDSVALYVASCPLQANAPNTQRIALTGPFLPGTSYVAQYLPPAGSELPGTHGLPGPYQRQLVIRAIGVTLAGGTEETYRNNVSQFLTANISNYCPLVPQNG